MYLSDVATIPVNLAGVASMSLPAGLSEGLPVGFQIIAPAMKDDRLYQVGGALERELHRQWTGPLTHQIPELQVR
jgi:aspartyl-tRNA(Asn)/glutamyl-tRNA(Gln) amidotransferase subunit A